MTPDDLEASLTIAHRQLMVSEYIDSARRREQELTYWSAELDRLKLVWFDLTIRPLPGSRIIFRHSLGNVALRTVFPERLNWSKDLTAWRFEP